MIADPQLQPIITGFDSDLLTPEELECLAIPSTNNLERLFNPRLTPQETDFLASHSMNKFQRLFNPPSHTATVLPLLATICNLRRRLAELNGSPCGE